MDLHVYRNSQDRWHDLRSAAREHGAVLAVNAVTFDELVQRLTPDAATATLGQQLSTIQKGISRRKALGPQAVLSVRYFYDAVSELNASRVRPGDLRSTGAELLAGVLDEYERELRAAG